MAERTGGAGDALPHEKSDPTRGRNEVRIAYVLKKEDLERSLLILGKALEAYNNRK